MFALSQDWDYLSRTPALKDNPLTAQYDLDSVLRFEQFTVVEDKQAHRGPRAVQLRMTNWRSWR